mgnify:CR=1 FL=1
MLIVEFFPELSVAYRMVASTWSIKEGLTIKEIADVLYDEGVIYDKNTFIDMCKTDDGTLKEGFLFPDTYEFYINSSADRILASLIYIS